MLPQILIASGAAVLGLLGTLHIIFTFFTNKRMVVHSGAKAARAR